MYEYRYVLNLCGQDFPTKTNFELTRELKTLDGKNEVFSVDINIADKLWRIKEGYRLKDEYAWAYSAMNRSLWDSNTFFVAPGQLTSEEFKIMESRRAFFL